MRPEIEGLLEQRIEDIYKEAGYGTATELVRDAVRSHLNDLEARVTDESTFRDQFIVRKLPAPNSPPEIRLVPADDGDISFERFEPTDPPTVLLDTGTAYVKSNEIESVLGAIDGVELCAVPEFGSDIRLYVAETNERPLDSVVTDAFEALHRLIERANERVRQHEITREELLQEIVQNDWPELNNESL